MKDKGGDKNKDKKEAACEPCRKSHVKCDRAKPACGVCTRRGIQHRCFGAESSEPNPNVAFVSHAPDISYLPIFDLPVSLPPEVLGGFAPPPSPASTFSPNFAYQQGPRTPVPQSPNIMARFDPERGFQITAGGSIFTVNEGPNAEPEFSNTIGNGEFLSNLGYDLEHPSTSSSFGIASTIMVNYPTFGDSAFSVSGMMAPESVNSTNYSSQPTTSNNNGNYTLSTPPPNFETGRFFDNPPNPNRNANSIINGNLAANVIPNVTANDLAAHIASSEDLSDTTARISFGNTTFNGNGNSSNISVGNTTLNSNPANNISVGNATINGSAPGATTNRPITVTTSNNPNDIMTITFDRLDKSVKDSVVLNEYVMRTIEDNNKLVYANDPMGYLKTSPGIPTFASNFRALDVPSNSQNSTPQTGIAQNSAQTGIPQNNIPQTSTPQNTSPQNSFPPTGFPQNSTPPTNLSNSAQIGTPGTPLPYSPAQNSPAQLSASQNSNTQSTELTPRSPSALSSSTPSPASSTSHLSPSPSPSFHTPSPHLPPPSPSTHAPSPQHSSVPSSPEMPSNKRSRTEISESVDQINASTNIVNIPAPVGWIRDLRAQDPANTAPTNSTTSGANSTTSGANTTVSGANTTTSGTTATGAATNSTGTVDKRDEMISYLQAEVRRLEFECRMQSFAHQSPISQPTWNQGIYTSLWDVTNGILLECNRNFYLRHRPRFSVEHKSIVLTGTDACPVVANRYMGELQKVSHTHFVFQTKKHGEGFMMYGVCRIIRGANSHLVSTISWDV